MAHDTSRLCSGPPSLGSRKACTSQLFIKHFPKHSLCFPVTQNQHSHSCSLCLLHPSLWCSSLASPLLASHERRLPSLFLSNFKFVLKFLFFGEAISALREEWWVSCSITLCHIPLRRGLSLNLELGWQRTNLGNPPSVLGFQSLHSHTWLFVWLLGI